MTLGQTGRVQTYHVLCDEQSGQVWYFKELKNLPGNFVRLNCSSLPFFTKRHNDTIIVQLNPKTTQLRKSPDLPDIYHIVHN